MNYLKQLQKDFTASSLIKPELAHIYLHKDKNNNFVAVATNQFILGQVKLDVLIEDKQLNGVFLNSDDIKNMPNVAKTETLRLHYEDNYIDYGIFRKDETLKSTGVIRIEKELSDFPKYEQLIPKYKKDECSQFDTKIDPNLYIKALSLHKENIVVDMYQVKENEPVVIKSKGITTLLMPQNR